MKLGTSSGIIVCALLLGGRVEAEPDRAPTLSVGAGLAAYEQVEAGFSEDPEGGAYLAVTLAWDRELSVDPDRPAIRGDVVPELTLARLVDRSTVLLGTRLELEFTKSAACGCSRDHAGSLWAAPRLGLIGGGASAVVGGDIGFSVQVPRTRWMTGFWWGALTWKDPTDAAAPATGIGFAGAMEPVDRERMFALTFGVTLGRAYD